MRNLIVRMSTLMMMVLVGAGAAAAQPSAEPDPPAGEARARAEDAYDTAFIVFEDEYAAYINVRHGEYSSYGTVSTVRSAVPIRGIQRERLAAVDFYNAVGRADLAGQYESRRRKRRVLTAAAAGTFLASSVFLAVGAFTWVDRPDEGKMLMIGGGAAFIGSLALGGIALGIDSHPVGESERRMLAHEHNERLRRQLRLPRRREVSLSPFVFGEGGGLMAVGTF